MKYQKITKASKISQQNNSEKVTNEKDKKVLKNRYISPRESQKISHNLRAIMIV